MEDNNKVIILGAGLAGLSLALGMSNMLKDADIHVVEKQFSFARSGTAFGLALNGQKALQDLSPGIVSELQEVGITMETGGLLMGWWNCRDALLSRVQCTPSIKLHMGWLLQEIVEHDDYVQATFHKVPSDGTPTSDIMFLKGVALIGADGVNSVVRGYLKLPKATTTGVMMWRSRLVIDPAEASPEAALLRRYLEIPISPIMRPRGPVFYSAFNFHSKLPGTMALVINFRGEDGDGILSGTSPQQWMEAHAQDDTEIAEIRAFAILCDQEGFQHPVRQKVVQLPTNNGHGWGGKGRITVLGDAAHGKYAASKAGVRGT
jgi:2-polyprenyl-6-methoxyphenol hydroxylase-like FAD-dependent oxidoreductase